MEMARRGDVYLAGSPDYIAIGGKKKLLVAGTERRVAYLIPAIIVPKGNPAGIRALEDLARPGVRVGMGNPDTVCLGLYGVEILDRAGLLEKVLTVTLAVFAKSCEDTAMLAVLGKVDAILGWDVFASWNPAEVEWVRLDPRVIPRISYVAMALPVFARDARASREFMDYVTGPEGRRIFSRWGYLADENAARTHAPRGKIGGEYALPANYRELIGTGK
jgi:molybdate transport system substrate-binding protein